MKNYVIDHIFWLLLIFISLLIGKSEACFALTNILEITLVLYFPIIQHLENTFQVGFVPFREFRRGF